MDVVYAIVEGFQFFIPIIAILTFLGVLWVYKDGINNEEQPKKLNKPLYYKDNWKDENDGQEVKNEKKES